MLAFMGKYEYLLLLGIIFIGNLLLLYLCYYTNKRVLKERNIHELKKHYWGRKKEFIKYTSKWDIRDNTIFFSSLVSGAILLFTISGVIYENAPNVWEGTGVYINEMPSLLLNTFMGLFAIIGIAASVNKKHFITFGITDIFDYFKIREKIFRMLLLIVLSFIIYYGTAILHNINDYQFYFAIKSLNVLNFIWFFYYAIRVVWITGSVCVSNPNFELKVLDNLYQNFAYKEVRVDTEIWNTEGAIYDLEHLLDKYLLNKKSVKWEKIKGVRFDTVYKENNNIKQTAYKAIGIYFAIIFGLSVMISSYKFDIWVISFLFSIYMVIAVVVYLVKPIRLGLISTVYFRCGYFVEYCKITKYEVGVTSPISDWYKYIYSLECILYFYKIVINKKSDSKDNANIENEIIKYIESRNQEGECDLVLGLLLYLKYEKNDNIKNWDEMYWKIIETNCISNFANQNCITYQLANAVISDINRDTNGDKNSVISFNKLELKNDKFLNFCKFINDINLKIGKANKWCDPMRKMKGDKGN